MAFVGVTVLGRRGEHRRRRTGKEKIFGLGALPRLWRGKYNKARKERGSAIFHSANGWALDVVNCGKRKVPQERWCQEMQGKRSV